MIYLILHNIRSAYNVGSIFRTADAAGVDRIYLTGFSPEPIDRFGRKRKDIQKSALGAEDTVAWEYAARPSILIKKLKKEGVYVVGVEQSPDAVDYKKLSEHTFCQTFRSATAREEQFFSKKICESGKVCASIAYMFGNEIKGLSPQLLKKCNVIAEIPMLGKKESLNVGVAVGIVLFRMLEVKP